MSFEILILMVKIFFKVRLGIKHFEKSQKNQIIPKNRPDFYSYIPKAIKFLFFLFQFLFLYVVLVHPELLNSSILGFSQQILYSWQLLLSVTLTKLGRFAFAPHSDCSYSTLCRRFLPLAAGMTKFIFLYFYSTSNSFHIIFSILH